MVDRETLKMISAIEQGVGILGWTNSFPLVCRTEWFQCFSVQGFHSNFRIWLVWFNLQKVNLPTANVQEKLVIGFDVVGTCIFKREISLSFPFTVDRAYFLENVMLHVNMHWVFLVEFECLFCINTWFTTSGHQIIKLKE